MFRWLPLRIANFCRYRFNTQFIRYTHKNLGFDGQIVNSMNRERPRPKKYSEVELRMLSSYHEPIMISHLSSQRSLFTVSGDGAKSVLNGLITNDISLLDDKENVIFTYALNPKGRILYEMLIYRFTDVAPLLDSVALENFTGTEESYVIECEHSQMDELIRHIRVYMLRRKLRFIKLEELNLFTTYPTPFICDISQFYKVFNDPRHSVLGSRVLMKKTDHIEDYIKHLIKVPIIFYKDFLNHNSIPQGPIDIPPGKYHPLQFSGDLMNGISFSKGCYLGQELTTRTHYTGNVRKRLLSLRRTTSSLSLVVEPGFEILDSCDFNAKVIGKVVNFDNYLCSGIGLVDYKALRVVDCPTAIRIPPERIEKIAIYPPVWWNSKQNSTFEKSEMNTPEGDEVQLDTFYKAYIESEQMKTTIQNLKFINES